MFRTVRTVKGEKMFSSTILAAALTLTTAAGYSGSYDCNSGRLPWGHHFAYESTAVQVQPELSKHFFVTVVYSEREHYKSQYLRQWLHMHPALKDLQRKTNFREISDKDPIYLSYLQSKLPQLPAVVITLPADNNYMGRAIYVAYGRYLPTNPNTLAKELQVTFDKYAAAYNKTYNVSTKHAQYTQCRPGQICRPPQYYPEPRQPNINVELPIVRPRVEAVSEDNNTKILLLLFGAIVIFFMVQKRR
jgi:hypothetical protein